jgi:hypothetical protein
MRWTSHQWATRPPSPYAAPRSARANCRVHARHSAGRVRARHATKTGVTRPFVSKIATNALPTTAPADEGRPTRFHPMTVRAG